MENEPRGRPSKTFEDQELEELLEEDDSQNQKQMAEQLGCTRMTISRRLKALGKRQIQGKWVPHKLSDRQQENRKLTSGILLERQERKSFLHQIITGDEKWVYLDNPKRKKIWATPGTSASTSKPTPRPDRFGKKTMLCVFWDQRGVLYWELLLPGQTVTADRYQQQLRELNRILPLKRPEWDKRREKSARVVLLHDNASPHIAISVKEVLRELQWETLPHPPYSPDLAPSDYHLFRSMQHGLSGQHFPEHEDVRKWLVEWFDTKGEKFFKDGIRQLPEKWRLCVASDGAYFD